MQNITFFHKIKITCRLDPESFQQPAFDYLGAKTKLIKLCEFISTGPPGTILSNVADSKKEIKIFRPSNLNDWGVTNKNLIYTTQNLCQKYKIKLYQKNDVLVSRIGYLKFGIVGESKNFAISSNLIIIRTNKKLLNPFFLLAFLNSEKTRHYLSALQKKSSLNSITTTDISEIPIPEIPLKLQTKIGQYLKKSLSEKKLAEKKYFVLEKNFLKKIKFKKTFSKKIQLAVNFLQIQKTKRLDAEYLQQQKINDNQFNKITLSEICEISSGLEPGQTEYKKKGILFLRPSNISEFFFLKKNQKYISKKLFYSKLQKYQPQKNEILFAKDGKPGFSLVVKKPLKGIISSGIVRLKIKQDINPDYVAFCLNSPFCRTYVNSHIDGTLIPHLKIEQIKNIPIPVLSAKIQNSIISEVKKIHQLYVASDRNLSKAIGLTDQLTH